MAPDIESIVNEVAEIAPMLHTAGALSPAVLRAIFRHAKTREVRFSVETGSGASTLLFSHLSPNHLVFARDDGSGSIDGIRRFELLNQATVTFVDGPTQTTLPRFIFENLFQLALIDGPHAYPFPDLEYFYLYPWLSQGALLILDDIHIRTVNNLFCFLREDAMFHLDEVVGTTAFFTRTPAPLFSPRGDGWEKQRYNKKVLRRYELWPLIDSLPGRFRRFTRAKNTIAIDHPTRNLKVGATGLVTGTARPLHGFHVWVLVRRKDQTGWWPQAAGPLRVVDGRWECNVNYGETRDIGFTFEIAAIYAGSSVNRFLLSWVNGAAHESCSPIDFAFWASGVSEARREVIKAP